MAFQRQGQGGSRSVTKGYAMLFVRACKRLASAKSACIHTLRHSYATHLLEMGLDIVSGKKPTGPCRYRHYHDVPAHCPFGPPRPVLPPWKSYTAVPPDNSLGGVIRQFLPALLKDRGVSSDQLKVLRALAACRTPGMGGSAMVCNDCGSVHYVLHSCRNRHCPRCQGID